MKKIAALLSIVLVIAACNNEPTDRILRESKGTHNEMMLVMDDDLWSGSFGGLVVDRLAEPFPGLNRQEPRFDLHQVELKAFGELFETYKSLVFFTVDPDTTASYRVMYNRWAAPQIIATFTAPSKLELAQLFNEKEDRLTELFEAHDMKVLARRLRRVEAANLPPALKEVGIEKLLLPEEYKLTQDLDGLKIFFSDNARTATLKSIFFHVRPIDDEVMPGTDIIEVRDSILKYNYEGPSEGSYPGTEMLERPKLSTTEIDGNLAFELRGMWKTYNDFMGGTFLSYSIYDEDRGVIITADSFVYAPRAKKRKLMMEMEVILRSIVLTKEDLE